MRIAELIQLLSLAKESFGNIEVMKLQFHCFSVEGRDWVCNINKVYLENYAGEDGIKSEEILVIE